MSELQLLPRLVADAGDLPEEDRGWRFHRALQPLFDSVPRERGAGYRGRLEVFRVGEALLTKSHLGAATSKRTAQGLADGIDMYGVQVFLKGRMEVSRATYRGHRGPGGIAIIDTAQPMENVATDAVTYNLSIPRRVLGPLLREPDAHHGRFLPSDAPLSALALGHLRAVFEELTSFTQEEAKAVLVPTIELIAGALNDLRGSAPLDPQLVAAADALRVRRYISCHLTDPTLTVGAISERLLISRKRLARMFEDEGGPAASIQRRRLELTKRWLLDSQSTTPVAEIGALAGFASDATFFRAFKKAFESSPSELRNRAQAPTERSLKDWLSAL